MRAVFFGTPELAVPSLAATAGGHEVTAVVCQPDRPKGRSGKLMAPPVKRWAEQAGIPVRQPLKLNDGTFEAWLRDEAPDICVLAAYGRILKQPILDVPTHGFINMHPSLLPKYRGPSPIQTALLRGETETGITIMRLDAGMDSGDIVLQEACEIEAEEDAATLSARLGERGGALIAEALALIEAGGATYTPQAHDEATYSTIFRKEDGRVRWGDAAAAIHNLVRATTPWPSAQCLFHGAVCRILGSQVVERVADAAPGTVTAVEQDRFLVATGKGQLAVTLFQAPGKRAMPAADYLRGHAIAAGDRFGEIAE